MYLDINGIKAIQIDHTSRCNLLCPQCARVNNGVVNSIMPLDELTVSDYEVIFPRKIIKNIDLIIQCGNYGDVLASSTILDCLDWLRTNGCRAQINILTNGSARDSDWWRELARILGKNGKVAFSIDGLRNTNHLYRVNSNWNKIIENINIFIGAGGRARWDYLVFEHNEHQVKRAKKLAKKLGFESFYVKKTNRFIKNKNYISSTGSKKDKVKTRKDEYNIKIPSKTEYLAKSNTDFPDLIKKYGSWDAYIDITKISCKFQQQKEIFVDFEARLWPCTWTAAPIYFAGEDNIQKIQLHKVLNYYGWDFNSLRHHSLEEILNHEWFKKEFTESWGRIQDDIPIGKLMTCGRTCGTSYDFSSSSEDNRQLTEFIDVEPSWWNKVTEYFQ